VLNSPFTFWPWPGRKQYFHLSLSALRELDQRILAAVVRKTLPLTGNELLWVLGTVLTFKAYCLVDEPNIASLTIVETVSNAAFLFFSGFAAAVAVLVGARLGARRFDEARQNAYRLLAMGLFVSLSICVLVLAGAAPITRLFNVSEHIRSLALSMLRIQAGIYPVIILNVLFFLTLRTGGDVKAMLIMDAFFAWIITIPVAFGLALLVRPPLPVFYLVIQLTEIVKFSIALLLFRRGRWLKNLT
jgi:Na+-driven multidrug efflux pump